MATVIGEFVAKIGTDMKGFEGGLASADKKMGGFVKGIAKHRKAIGIGMTAMGGAVIAGLGVAIKSSMDFNKEMANISTLIPGAIERVNELKSSIREMAVGVGKDTADLAGGVYEVISAFGDTADTVDILEIAAKAATAGVLTAKEAVGLLSGVTKGYGDTSKEAVKKASDLAFQAVTLGQTTFPELAASMGRVIPLTAELGVSQEELFAVMATGTGVTGKAAEVATQLRGIMQSLMSPTADMIKLFEKKKYASGEAMLADKGLAGALELIKDTADETNTPLQKYISSIEGQTLALALTGTQADAYVEKLAKMRDSVGLTDIAFKEQTEGVNKAGFAFEQAKIQIAVIAQGIGDNLLPQLTPLIGKVGEVVGKVSAWMKANPELVGTIIKVVAVIGGLLVVAGPLLIMLPGIISFLHVLGPAFALLLGPVGLVIAAIAALIAVGVLVWKNWDTIRAKAVEIWGAITMFFQGIWGTIKKIFEEHGLTILSIMFPFLAIPLQIIKHWSQIKEFFIKVAKWIEEPILKAVNAVINSINSMIEFMNKIPFVNIPTLKTIGTPTTAVPGFATGGVVPGSPGEPRLIMAHGGETISPRSSMGDIHIHVAGSVISERDLGEIIREQLYIVQNRNYSLDFI